MHAHYAGTSVNMCNPSIWFVIFIFSVSDVDSLSIVKVDVRANCLDNDCDRVQLKIDREDHSASFTVHLKKRFSIDIGSCSFYINTKGTKFAGFRLCKQSTGANIPAEEWEGTFFDPMSRRIRVAKTEGYHMSEDNFKQETRVVASLMMRNISPVDRLLLGSVRSVTDDAAVPQIIRNLTAPVIETAVTFDISMMRFFNQREDEAILFACSIINLVDAMYASAGISVRLVALHFLPKYNFTDFPPNKDEDYLSDLRSLISGFLIAGENEELTNRTSIAGVPDVVMTFTQFYQHGEQGRTEGLAYYFNSTSRFRGFGFVKPRQPDPLLLGNLSLYRTAVSFAHEVGHTLGHVHALPECSCRTKDGFCIMWETGQDWPIPVWTKCETKIFNDMIQNGSLSYLKEQNVRWLSERGREVTSADGMALKKTLKIICILALIFDVVLITILITFGRSRHSTCGGESGNQQKQKYANENSGIQMT